MGNSINNIKFLGRKFTGIRNLSIGPVYDPDAQAYFNANTAITSTADKNAINTFYLGLKSDGIYSKIKAMYLPIWGSSATCKWNLINPLDTDGAFRLTFSNGFTYSNSGITGNGTSAYIDTYFTPSTAGLTQNSVSMGFYSRTTRVASNSITTMGVDQTTNRLLLRARTVGDNSLYFCNDAAGNALSGTTDTKGFYQLSRTTSTAVLRGRNTYNSVNTNSVGINNIKIYVFANNLNNTVSGYEVIQGSFFYIGTGLTLTEMNNFYTKVQTLMTYFGINV